MMKMLHVIKKFLKKVLILTSVVFALCAPLSSALAKNVIPTIMLDPGHDLKSPGAISSSGIPEYEFNLIFVHELEKALTKEGYKVAISHQDDEPKALSQRINQIDYDLFVSIHHDSVQEEFCKFDENNICTTYSGYGYSLWASPLSKQYQKSLKVAKLIGNNLKSQGFIHSVHHVAMEKREILDAKNGIFSFPYLYVVRNNKKPAILIEIAVITNPIDEKNALSPDFRQKFITSITSGIKSYFSNTK